MTQSVRTYLGQVRSMLATGAATEHTYRPALADLFQAIAPTIKTISAPQRIACGAPDLAILREGLMVGHCQKTFWRPATRPAPRLSLARGDALRVPPALSEFRAVRPSTPPGVCPLSASGRWPAQHQLAVKHLGGCNCGSGRQSPGPAGFVPATA